MTNFAASNILFCESTTLNNILFSHKFFQSKYLSDRLITSAQNVEVSTLLKIIRRAIRLIGNWAVADRVLCVTTRTLRKLKTLCSVRKTSQKRTDWIVRSHVKLAFTDWLYTE